MNSLNPGDVLTLTLKSGATFTSPVTHVCKGDEPTFFVICTCRPTRPHLADFQVNAEVSGKLADYSIDRDNKKAKIEVEPFLDLIYPDDPLYERAQRSVNAGTVQPSSFQDSGLPELSISVISLLNTEGLNFSVDGQKPNRH